MLLVLTTTRPTATASSGPKEPGRHSSRVQALVLFLLPVALHVHLGRVRELVQQDVLAAAEAELDDVLLLELVVALRLDALVVQVGAVAGGQVDDVGPHPAAHGAVGARELHQPGDTQT